MATSKKVPVAVKTVGAARTAANKLKRAQRNMQRMSTDAAKFIRTPRGSARAARRDRVRSAAAAEQMTISAYLKR